MSKKQRRLECRDDNGNLILSVTENQLQKLIDKQLEKLIELCCEMKGAHNILEIAYRVLELNGGTEKERAVLAFMIDNDMIPEYTYCYEDDYNEIKESK